jgi:hypothetical protein
MVWAHQIIPASLQEKSVHELIFNRSDPLLIKIHLLALFNNGLGHYTLFWLNRIFEIYNWKFLLHLIR